MNNKFYLLFISFALISNVGFSQSTVEMSTTNFTAGSGPSTVQVGAIPFMKDASNNNQLVVIDPLNADYTTAIMKFENQVFTGRTYNNISTGLVFGASPTSAVDNVTPATPTQRVNTLPIYNNLGYYDITPGGPTDNMFTVAASFPSGTGILAIPDFFAPNPQPIVNGAISVFTAAQVLYDAPAGTYPHNAATRYYYGDLVINLNRFIANPTLHIAGLGGSYRYCPTGLDPANTANWVATFFTTELEVEGANVTKLSGNADFTASGSIISNSNPTPNGASVSTALAGTLFDEIGGASGSVRVATNTNLIRIKIYLRGSDNTTNILPLIGGTRQWSAPQSAVNGSNRNPFTGDIWWVSVSAATSALIPLPSTGVHLVGAIVGNDVKLDWKTQTEINTKNFEIQRSTDGTNFSSIDVKDAVGNSITESKYDYTDANMNASIYYYRLKMVDIDGRFTYSNIVNLRKAGNTKGIRLYPNPATDNVTLVFENAKGSYSIKLFNQAGQEVMNKSANVLYNVQTVGLERNSLAAGYYLIQIRNINDGTVSSEKVIFQ